jgi:hypothetical protein
MRIGFFGAALAGLLASLANAASEAGHRATYRTTKYPLGVNDHEPFDAVVVEAERLGTDSIKDYYTGRGTPVLVLAPKEPREAGELLDLLLSAPQPVSAEEEGRKAERLKLLKANNKDDLLMIAEVHGIREQLDGLKKDELISAILAVEFPAKGEES